MTKEQKVYWRKYKDDHGITWKKLTEVINAELGTNYTNVRDMLKRVRYEDVHEDTEERKPKYDFTDDGYRVYYGKNQNDSVKVTEEDLIEAFSLYCLAGLTMNQVCLKMSWTRRQFFAIKLAFDITKTDMPFTPRQLDEHTADELAEITRIYKKRFALEKYEANKYKDIEQRIKQMDQADYWLNQIIEKSNKIEPVNVKVKPLEVYDNMYVINMADLHIGLEVDNYFGKYDTDVVYDRLSVLMSNVTSNIPTGSKVHVSDLGDVIHGSIHGSTYKYGGWVTTAAVEAIKFYVTFLTWLVKEGYVVSFSKINGSHSSLEKAKHDRTEEDNMGNVVYEMIKYKLEDWDICFIDKMKGLNMVQIPIMGNYRLDVHGDNQSPQQKRIMDRVLSNPYLIEVNQGHIHHEKSEDFSGLAVYANEPYCATDQYAGNKALNSQSGVRIVEYTQQGRGKEWLCKFNNDVTRVAF